MGALLTGLQEGSQEVEGRKNQKLLIWNVYTWAPLEGGGKQNLPRKFCTEDINPAKNIWEISTPVMVLTRVMVLASVMVSVFVMVLACDGWGRGTKSSPKAQSWPEGNIPDRYTW